MWTGTSRGMSRDHSVLTVRSRDSFGVGVGPGRMMSVIIFTFCQKMIVNCKIDDGVFLSLQISIRLIIII